MEKDYKVIYFLNLNVQDVFLLIRFSSTSPESHQTNTAHGTVAAVRLISTTTERFIITAEHLASGAVKFSK